jgi:hypothetical protein
LLRWLIWRIFRDTFHDGFLERAVAFEQGVMLHLAFHSAQVRSLKWAFTITDLRLGTPSKSHLIPFIHYTIETNLSALTLYVTTIVVL